MDNSRQVLLEQVSKRTDSAIDDTTLENSGSIPCLHATKRERKAEYAPTPDEGILVYFLARELGVTVARIIRAVSCLLPYHRNLPTISPRSTIGPLLAREIRTRLSPVPPLRPVQPQDIVWED